jgi:ABC-2 type transport system ATP-binding protein
VPAQHAVRADVPGSGQWRPTPGAVIEAAGLTKRYQGSVNALDQLTVVVAPGVTGLVGANGAGKSTLIKILLGLLAPTSGQAAVLGHDCETEGSQIRTLTGYMPEHDCLPPDVTATEFVAHMGRMSGLPPTAAKERAADSLRHVGLYEERYRQIGTYSTGMKQRVKLAQALVGDPRLLLLDEPTNGLDPAGRSSMLDLISRIGAEFGISILVASHLLGEIEQICDHLVAIDAGRLLRADTISSVTRASEVLLVEVEEGGELLAAELTSRGLMPVPQQRGLLIQLAGEQTYDAVRDAIADLGLPLSRMEQRRHRLEELFQDEAIPGQQGPGQQGPGQQGPGQQEPGQQEPGQQGPGTGGPATQAAAAQTTGAADVG